MTAQRSGLPALTDTLGQYRLHCDQVADGELPRSCCSLLFEKVCVDGEYVVRTFGMAGMTLAEQIGELVEMLRALEAAADRMCDAQPVTAH